jgi:hypothetical protein
MSLRARIDEFATDSTIQLPSFSTTITPTGLSSARRLFLPYGLLASIEYSRSFTFKACTSASNSPGLCGGIRQSRQLTRSIHLVPANVTAVGSHIPAEVAKVRRALERDVPRSRAPARRHGRCRPPPTQPAVQGQRGAAAVGRRTSAWASPLPLNLQNLHPRFKSGRRLQIPSGKSRIQLTEQSRERQTVTEPSPSLETGAGRVVFHRSG